MPCTVLLVFAFVFSLVSGKIHEAEKTFRTLMSPGSWCLRHEKLQLYKLSLKHRPILYFSQIEFLFSRCIVVCTWMITSTISNAWYCSISFDILDRIFQVD